MFNHCAMYRWMTLFTVLQDLSADYEALAKAANDVTVKLDQGAKF